MPTTEWASPGTVEDGGGAGTFTWSSPSSAAAQNDGYADAGASGPAQAEAVATNSLRATGFGFAIPAGATVDGVEVEVDAYGTGSTRPTFSYARLRVDGADGSTDRSSGATLADTDTDAYTAIGGAADLWGAGSLSEGQVEATGFGISLRYTIPGNVSPCLARVDHVRMRVHYTEVSAPARHPSSYVIATC